MSITFLIFYIANAYKIILIQFVVCEAVTRYIVTHTDVDGVAAAALYTYLTKESAVVIFTEPYSLRKELYKVYRKRPVKVVVLDLSPNSDAIDFIVGVIELLRERGGSTIWLDHHVWEAEWAERLRGAGAELYVDRSTCATGVVAKYIKPSTNSVDWRFVEELVKGVCGADLWKFDHPLSPFFMRLVRRGDEDSWRLYVYNTLAKGIMQVREFEERVAERFAEEVEELSKHMQVKVFEVNGIRMAIVEKNEKVENSILAARVMGFTMADIVAVVDRSGKISLRSRGVNVRDLALALGGGGHAQAAGAKIAIPLSVKLAGIFNNKALIEYVEYMLKEHANYIKRL
jgi:oligoribonuclease NrnB/cAMP/cGMP phosphodiesterase (DHH superfamily)